MGLHRFLSTLGACLFAMGLFAFEFDVRWDYLEGMIEDTTGDLVKVHPDGWGNNAAISSNFGNTNESMWLIVDYDTNYRKHAIGLTRAFEDAHYNSIDYCFYMEDGNLFIIEDGVVIGLYATLSQGDQLKILKRNGAEEIEFYHNGVLKHEVVDSNDSRLYVKSTCYYSGDSFGKIRTSVLGHTAFVWDTITTDLVFTPNGSSFKINGFVGLHYEDFAISKNFIAPGEDAAIQFTVKQTGYLNVGLTDDKNYNPVPHHTRTKVEHEFFFTSTTTRIYENNHLKLQASGAPKNYRFSLLVKDDTVRYYKGQTLLRETPLNSADTLWLLTRTVTKQTYGANVGFANFYVDFGQHRVASPSLAHDHCGQDLNISDSLSILTNSPNDLDSLEFRVSNINDTILDFIYTTSSNPVVNDIMDSTWTSFQVSVRGYRDAERSNWSEDCLVHMVDSSFIDTQDLMVRESFLWRIPIDSLASEDMKLTRSMFYGDPVITSIILSASSPDFPNEFTIKMYDNSLNLIEEKSYLLDVLASEQEIDPASEKLELNFGIQSMGQKMIEILAGGATLYQKFTN